MLYSVFEKYPIINIVITSSVIFVALFNMTRKRKNWHWIVLAILSLIWGTSYILIKKGLESFSPLQIATLRIFITFLCLLPVAIRNLNKLNRDNINSVVIIGLLGNAIPAFLFPIAQTKISSSLAGMLNTLSPVFTLLLGIMFYKRQAIKSQIAGVFIGLVGAGGLLYNGSLTFNLFGLFVVLATILNAFSANEASRTRGLNGLQITALSFFLVGPLAITYLLFSDISAVTESANWGRNLGCIILLSVMGSAVAQILYYQLVMETTPLFASIVTYFIPVIATMWGLADNEKLTFPMLISIIVIFAGVFIISKPEFLRKIRQIIK